MKQFILLFCLSVAGVFSLKAQCPPGNLSLSSQGDIDAFVGNYPGCSMINGNLTISGVDINDLQELSVLTSISGSLTLSNNTILSSLNGLEGLTYVGGVGVFSNPQLSDLDGLAGLSGAYAISGALNIQNNTSLSSLGGLSGVTSIGGSVFLFGNPGLIDFTGLNAVTSIGGALSIFNNVNLHDLDGLESVGYIGGFLTVKDNPSLVSLAPLQTVASIGGFLAIENNDLLTSLNGLDNIDYTAITHLYLQGSAALSSCEVPSICSYVNHNRPATISGNATGCTTRLQIETACPTVCPAGDLFLYTQAEVDAFPANYHRCSALPGDLLISSGADIVNLDSLSALTAITGSLSLSNCTVLNDITGLENMNAIGGVLDIETCNNLTNLTSLNGVTSLGGLFLYNTGMTNLNWLSPLLTSLPIYLTISDNPSLLNMNGLANITSVGGSVSIGYNPLLTNLSGLGGINTIGLSLFIVGNEHLSSLSGLSPLLTSIPERLAIALNPSLTNLNGLGNITFSNTLEIGYNFGLTSLNGLSPALTTLQSYVEISGNHALTDLGGLEHISSIGSSLYITYNDGLQSLDGLDGLQSIGAQLYISINNNTALTTCAVQSLCTHLNNGGDAVIYGNAPGCNSRSEVQDACLALPLELLEFEAFAKGETVQLHWRSANEINFSHFDIERSPDGRTWSLLGVVPGNGSADQVRSYQFTDSHPLPLGYYRLRETDFGGSTTFSNIISVEQPRSEGVVHVMPNPSHGRFRVQWDLPPETTTEMTVTDATGRLVQQQQFSDTVKEIDLTGHAPGVYTLSLRNGNMVAHRRVVLE